MEYKVLKQVSLARKSATGKTKHFLGNHSNEMPMPSALQIAQYDDDDGYYLLYMNEDGKEMTDTYHETLKGALEQAEWEYGILPEEWTDLT